MDSPTPKYLRRVCLECPTPHEYRWVRQRCLENPQITGAALDGDTFLVTNEVRFRYTKSACRANEVKS